MQYGNMNMNDAMINYAAGIILQRGDANSADQALARATAQSRAVDGALERLVNTPLTWVPSGPIRDDLRPGNDFVRFLDGEDLRLNDYRTTLNCWEAVLVAAMWGGLLEYGTELIRIYRADSPDEFSARLTRALASNSRGRVYAPNTPLGTPVRGDIVLFEGLNHVAIATGARTDRGTEILSFWPAPQLDVFGPGTPTAMLRTTIEAIAEWLSRNDPDDEGVITFGSPDWDALNQA